MAAAADRMIGAYLLHSGHAFTWSAWHPEPTLVGGVVLSVGLYGWRLSSLATYGAARPSRMQTAAFFAGVALVFVALGSPLDVGAGRLFALHMLQHIVLSTWAPPLLLLGLSASMIEPLFRLEPLGKLIRLLPHPLVGAPVFIINMWFWHVPAIYDVALTNQSVHYVMHISFLASGLMFWWTLAAPVRGLHPLGTGWRLFYIFFTGFPMMILAFALVATPSVLYDYYQQQPRLWGISALTDQQLGGALMGTLGELTMFIPFTLLFIRLTSEEEEGAHQAAELQPTPIPSNGSNPEDAQARSQPRA